MPCAGLKPIADLRSTCGDQIRDNEFVVMAAWGAGLSQMRAITHTATQRAPRLMLPGIRQFA